MFQLEGSNVLPESATPTGRISRRLESDRDAITFYRLGGRDGSHNGL